MSDSLRTVLVSSRLRLGIITWRNPKMRGLKTQMKKTAIVAAALAAFGLCASVFAEDAKTGLVPMTEVELDQVVAGVGNGSATSQLIQSIYGNTTNPRPSGNGVTPSLTPGPWACLGDCSNPKAGSSIGEIFAPLVSDGNGTPNFANGTTAVKDNFGEPYEHGGVGP